LIVGDFLKNNILLLGGTGTLGRHIIESNLFSNLIHPSKKKLNILNQNKIEKFILNNNIKIILHCAALARVKECENNKQKAISINTIGTLNIVKSILNTNNKVKLVFISSDAVYSPNKGNNKEKDKLKPYNFYGLTKVLAEKQVKLVKRYIIIRTRFFDKKNITFNYSAKNIYTSSLEVTDLVRYISKLIKINFKGIINVGGPKISDFKKYSKYKKNIKPCDKKKIFKNLNLKIATNSTLNLNKLKSLI
tara:strand:+ start:2553 stop:3299 length:747 start_codon:yes stop_codon:yes gene_type:complete